MLSHSQLGQLCRDLRLSPEAQAIIETIRAAPPSRRVRGGAGNVTVRYPSRKMGVTIQAESHRNELAGIYEKEHDPATLEYYDQPPPIKLIYLAKTGRRVGVLHTPDYFVVRTDAVGWEEWKMAEELERLAEAMPHRYCRGAAGQWQCPPGEAYAQPLGFFYRVRSSAEIDWVFQRNLLFLEDYLAADCPPAAERASAIVRAVVAQQPGLLLRDLLGRMEGATSDDVYRLIATEHLFVDLHAAPLAEPERVRVFRDAASAHAAAVIAATALPGPCGGSVPLSLTIGASALWDGRSWTIVNVGQTTTALLAAEGALVEVPTATLEMLIHQGTLRGGAGPVQISRAAQERLAQASPEDLVEANRRYALLAPQLSGHAGSAPGTPARTLRRWRARWHAAEQLEHCGYVGLLPRRGQSGNRTRKLPEATLRLLDTIVATEYETLTQKGKFAVFAILVRACEEQGTTIPSYKTFAAALKRRPRQEQVARRQGPRAAAQEAPFYWELSVTTPRHGDRPFEIGHVDHTQFDVELVCAHTGHHLGRPWATFLSDAFSRRLLAVTLLFDHPSYRSCMLVLRECVRRFQRLPQTVVVDGGAEFAGVYFETLLARYGCAKKTRPGARPRFGSVCERLFGTTNTRFVHTLAGNTQLCQHVRQVTKTVDPKGQACWTLAALAARLDEWAYEVYDTLDHPALGQSPRDAFAAGIAQSGERLHRIIGDDEDFQQWTLPTTRRGTARVQRRLGVKIHHIYYWAEAFLDPEVEGRALSVRFDPFDAGIAYAFVKGRWVRCISEHYAQFAGRSEREVHLATVELRRRQQRHAHQLTLTARRLADFLVSLEAEEALLDQRLRDAAVRAGLAHRTREGGTASGPGGVLVLPARVCGAPGSTAPAAGESPAGEPRGDAGALVIYGDY
jgi:transposase InsO family protein